MVTASQASLLPGPWVLAEPSRLVGFPVLQPQEGQESGGRGWSCRVPGPDWPKKGKSQGLSSGPQPSPLVEGAPGLEWGTLVRGLLDSGRQILAFSASKLHVDETQDLKNAWLPPYSLESREGTLCLLGSQWEAAREGGGRTRGAAIFTTKLLFGSRGI